jgi:hypothetical protein
MFLGFMGFSPWAWLGKKVIEGKLTTGCTRAWLDSAGKNGLTKPKGWF